MMVINEIEESKPEEWPILLLVLIQYCIIIID